MLAADHQIDVTFFLKFKKNKSDSSLIIDALQFQLLYSNHCAAQKKRGRYPQQLFQL